MSNVNETLSLTNRKPFESSEIGQADIIILCMLYKVEIKKRSSYGSFPRELIRLMCCKLWISESRNLAALESVEEATKIRGESVTVVNRFLDPAYNRVVYTLVSHLNTSGAGAGDISASPLMETVSAMVEAAYAGIDLRRHSGTHPRFGVVDHICFHPLAGADLDQAAQLAKLLSSAVGHRFQGDQSVQLPCLTLMVNLS